MTAPEPNTKLVRVMAPHFVAGIVLIDGRCVRAAPILRWCIGRTEDQLRKLFARKPDWRVTVVRS